MGASDQTVSVIIPTRNRSAFLRRALTSVTAQTWRPSEIIVVDDGSTDDTSRWLPPEFPDVHYVQQSHCGVSAARNRGVKEASGEWIAFLDSDDAWLPAKLERQLESLHAHPEHALCHTDEIWMRRGRRVNPKDRHAKAGGFIFQRCLPLCVISPSSVMLRRSFLKDMGGFDETLPVCEDYDLWLRICSRHPVLYLDERLVIKHGGHSDQLSRRYWGMDRYRICALQKIVKSGWLSVEDGEAALRTLVGKIEIYLTGARKRGKPDVNTYEALLVHYRQRLAGQKIA